MQARKIFFILAAIILLEAANAGLIFYLTRFYSERGRDSGIAAEEPSQKEGSNPGAAQSPSSLPSQNIETGQTVAGSGQGSLVKPSQIRTDLPVQEDPVILPEEKIK